MASILPGETTTAQDPAVTSYLLVRLGNELYGLPGTFVREVTRWRPFTPVPGTPTTLPGIISQRGFVMPVVNIHSLLNVPESSPSRVTRYVIVKHDDVDMAILVDAVLDFINISASTFEPLPPSLAPQHARLLTAITRMDSQPVALLDVATLIAFLRTGD